jgi:hypothetical protein
MLFEVRVVKALFVKTDVRKEEVVKLLFFLTKEKEMRTFQIPELVQEAKNYIKEAYPDIESKEDEESLNLVSMINHSERNAEADYKRIMGLNFFPGKALPRYYYNDFCKAL